MIELRGYSGAIICVVNDAQGVFVRKSASMPEKNDRLRLQSEKQDNFYRAGIRCPRVLRDGYINGLYFYDMDYICGESLTSYLLHGNDVPSPVEACLLSFSSLKNIDIGVSYNSLDFINKINRIKDNIKNSDYFNKSSAGYIIDRMINLEWPEVEKTDCHGDLTFDNILVGRDGVYLIDFDSVDINSLVVDYAKLFQDTRGLWCLRSVVGRGMDVANIYSKFSKLDRLLSDFLYKKFGVDDRLCNQYAAFHLLRTLPYSRCRGDFTFALDAIDRLICSY